MNNDPAPQRGCSALLKLLFILSIILNIVFLLTAAYGYGLVKSFAEPGGGDFSLPFINDNSEIDTPIADHPMLNPEQEKMLDGLGIDVEKLPTEISSEMEDCFERAIGTDRVEEIKKGSVIGPLDIMKAKNCL